MEKKRNVNEIKMNNVLKFIAKLNVKDQIRIWNIIESLKKGSKRGKKLKNTDGLFSVRMGKIRIVYYGTKNNFKIHNIDWRDKVYKNL